MPRYLTVAIVQAEGVLVPLREHDEAIQAHRVPSGQRLVAVVNNGSWQAALDVSFPENLERILRRCRDGIWQDLALYLLPEKRVAEIGDGRRATMSGEPVREPERQFRR
jgi:hypothetical protein